VLWKKPTGRIFHTHSTHIRHPRCCRAQSATAYIKRCSDLLYNMSGKGHAVGVGFGVFSGERGLAPKGERQGGDLLGIA
jgi:hypothetical protein